MPRAYYLRRAVECYDQMGDLRAAADALAGFGTPGASADAARRYLALGDLPAAGEALLAAGQPRAALSCFQQAGLPEGALACLQALGDDAGAAALLLEQGRPAAAAPLLERALAAAPERDLAAQATLRLQLARALHGQAAAEEHYRAALALLPRLPSTAASAEAWAALGAWGAEAGRQDRAQEGYAQALRLLEQAGDTARWHIVAGRYREAARRMGNRRLEQILAARLAEGYTDARATS